VLSGESSNSRALRGASSRRLVEARRRLFSIVLKAVHPFGPIFRLQPTTIPMLSVIVGGLCSRTHCHWGRKSTEIAPLTQCARRNKARDSLTAVVLPMNSFPGFLSATTLKHN